MTLTWKSNGQVETYETKAKLLHATWKLCMVGFILGRDFIIDTGDNK
jgi:hypothetical protein